MRIVSFVNETKENVIQQLLDISGTGTLTRRTVPFSVGTADVAVIRGGAVEKAAVTHLTMNQVKPPEADAPIDYMVFQMEIFPENPNCPMGHFNTEWSITGPGPYHMNLDLFPAVRIEEDLAAAASDLDRIAQRFGADKGSLRSGLDEHYNMPHWEAPLAAMAGCKLMHLHNGQLDLFTGAYHGFFDSYIDILTKRKDMPFTDEDLQLKLKRNGRWLEYITLKDVAVKMGLGVGLPPEVLIDLCYPPSAVF